LLADARSGAEVRSLRATYDEVSRRFPRVVVTAITPFGMSGPLAELGAHDVDFCALGTITTTIGEPGREPLTPPLELSGYQAGLCAASASLLALFARRRRGTGQLVDVSPLDAWATVHQGSGLMNALAFSSVTRRAGKRRPDAYPFHLMAAKDGLMCMIARDGSQWKRFVQDVVGDPALSAERYRDRRKMGLEYPEEVDALLVPWFAARTRSEIFALCRAAHVPFSPVRTLDEVASCEQLASRDFFVTIPSADGSAHDVRAPGAPYRLSATPWLAPSRAPRLGEHTAEVLAGAGDGDAELGSSPSAIGVG
jgi:crotonobetainyl-CoA:carnitine CoA-transferase CaiB-like acyl-CoA transferase